MQRTDTRMKIRGREDLDAITESGIRVARPVLLYSSGCRFCRCAARVVAALDRGGQLALLPLTDPRAGRLLATVPENTRTESWWIVRRDGMPVAGKGGAGIVLLTELRMTRRLGRVLGAIGLSAVIDALDGFIARYRGRLSRFVPDGPAPQRYP